MPPMLDVSLIDKTDWAAVEGAYGSSADVPQALRVLAVAADAQSDDWAEALNGTVLGHIWHQGDIYPVTPHALPFLVAIADEPRSAGRAEVARAAARIAQAAARYAHKKEEADAALGRATADVFAANAATIAGWLGGELDEPASLIASVVTALREPFGAFLGGRASFSPWHHLAVERWPEVPDWAYAGAEKEVAGETPAAIAAAVLLQRKTDLSDAVARRVDALTTPPMRAALEAALTCPWEIPEFQFRLRSAPTGDLVPCEVIFVGANLIYVQHPSAGRVVVRLGNEPLDGIGKGETLLVELSPAGRPRVVERTTASGETVRRVLE